MAACPAPRLWARQAATRLSKLQTDYPKEAAQMKKDEETGKAEAAGKKRPGVRK